jgi:hypothetical protein
MKLRQPKKTALEKQQLVIQKCKNKIATDQFIEQYRQSTKGAIEQILNMGTAVKDIYEKYKANELNKYDLNYFCMSVGINQKSSTFRKYEAIGKNADRFLQHMDKMPSAFSVLYEIATLDADTFEKVIIKNEFGRNLTLKQIRMLSNKPCAVPNKNKNSQSPIYYPPSQIAKYLNQINRFAIHISTSLTETELNSVIQVLDDLQKNGKIRYEMPTATQFVNDEYVEDLPKLAA